MPAKITEFYSTIGVYEGESLFLPCLLQGFPVPTSTWLKGRRGSGTSSASSSSSLVYTVSSSVDQGNSDGISSSLLLQSDIRRDPRVTIFDKIGLLIEKVSLSDAGFYSCHANNSAGRDTIQTEVSVYGKSLYNFSLHLLLLLPHLPLSSSSSSPLIPHHLHIDCLVIDLTCFTCTRDDLIQAASVTS